VSDQRSRQPGKTSPHLLGRQILPEPADSALHVLRGAKVRSITLPRLGGSLSTRESSAERGRIYRIRKGPTRCLPKFVRAASKGPNYCNVTAFVNLEVSQKDIEIPKIDLAWASAVRALTTVFSKQARDQQREASDRVLIRGEHSLQHQTRPATTGFRCRRGGPESTVFPSGYFFKTQFSTKARCARSRTRHAIRAMRS
jgi:hypothetical protein